MRLRPFPLGLEFCAALFVLMAVNCVKGQSDDNSASSEIGVALVKLYTPIYPEIARDARVTGDVNIQVEVRSDGSLSSVQVISGPPMNGSSLLKNAALESAQKSTFECHGCGQEAKTLSLTYTFNLREDIDCGFIRLRASKCLYLWKCGYRDKYAPRPTTVTPSENHISVVADSVCVESSASVFRN